MKKTIKIFLLFNIYLGFAQYDVPITLLQQFNGKYGYTIIGNTHNEFDNWQTPPPPCQMLTQSTATLNLNANQNIVAAYLTWSGIGNGQTTTPSLNGAIMTPDQILVSDVNPPVAPLLYFTALKEITNYVQNTGNGLYNLSNFDLNSLVLNYCTGGVYFSGWNIIVVYEDLSLPNQQLNIYNGYRFTYNPAGVPIPIQIPITNLNIVDNQNAKMTYIAWNGSPNLFFGENIQFNNNLLSTALNPVNNPFNSTNSFTGSTTSWNMDVDTFDISNYINIGDTSANITMNSVLIRFIQTIITSIRSELPDASVQINTVTGQEICGNRNLAVNYTVANTNSNAVLPANVPVSFYANNTLLQTIFTTAPVAIGASLPLSQNVTIPLAIPNNFVLKIKVNDNGTGASTVAESNLNNNESSQNITLSSDTVTPTFSIPNTFCQNATVPVLPLNSNNGISGTWSPNIINNQANGSYIFTPNAGQCANAFTLNVTILPLVTPTFNIQNTFCQGANVPTLPQNSTNNILGTWSPNVINNQVNSSYIFTPNAGQCANSFTLNVSINPNVTPTFTLANTFCQGVNVPVLPSISNNNISGTWSPNIINNQTNGSYIFTPNAGQCANAFTLNVTINPNVTPTFTLVNTFCQGVNVPVLPSISNNNISGTWSPNIINNQTNGSYIFTPNAGQCANAFILNVTISPLLMPIFNIQNTFCQGANVPVLPLNSNNGISGTWSPNVIDNQTNGSYIFTPNAGQCANIFTLNVTINPNVTPTFTLANTFCQGANVSVLPLNSNNGISGTWSPNVINNQANGSYIFTPNIGQCANAFTLNVTIIPVSIQEKKEYLCLDASNNPIQNLVLSTGLNAQNFQFQWFKDTILLTDNSNSLAVTTTGNYQVIANNNTNNCQQIFNFEVVALALPKIEITTTEDFLENPQITILVDGNLENYTFQLNNNVPQNSNIFLVNQGGEYTITISDTRGCHIIKKNVTIWQYPKFFTPNGDGFNDFWSIKTQKTININIFDRFGNLIKNLKRNQSWDGLLQGKPMPATDYWFVIEYQKNNETRIFKGHFGLKR